MLGIYVLSASSKARKEEVYVWTVEVTKKVLTKNEVERAKVLLSRLGYYSTTKAIQMLNRGDYQRWYHVGRSTEGRGDIRVSCRIPKRQEGTFLRTRHWPSDVFSKNVVQRIYFVSHPFQGRTTHVGAWAIMQQRVFSHRAHSQT